MGSNQIREDILYFLFRNNYWQNRHTPNPIFAINYHNIHVKKLIKNWENYTKMRW